MIRTVPFLVMFALPALSFAQGVEVPMTPTPTPTPAPAVSPIPTFPEKGATPAATPGPSGTGEKLRIDAGGMFGVGGQIGNTSTGATAKIWFAEDFAAQF